MSLSSKLELSRLPIENGSGLVSLGNAKQAAEKRCCPWFDKLTMRINSLKTLDLILSLSKDEGKFEAFSAAC
jgi:hypothetical protein